MHIYQRNNHVARFRQYLISMRQRCRCAVLTRPAEGCLKALIAQTVAGLQATVLELEVMPAHVDLPVSVGPQYSVHRLFRRIKGPSSRALRHEFPPLKSRLPSLWTHSYFVATVGGAPLAVIKQYIEDQKNV